MRKWRFLTKISEKIREISLITAYYDDVMPDGGEEIIPDPIVNSGMVENDMSDDQIRHDSQGDEGSGIVENEMTENTVINEEPVLNSRPKRDRKQNVRYSSHEYDLSAVSMNPGTAKLKLSSIFVQPKSGSGKLMKNKTQREV